MPPNDEKPRAEGLARFLLAVAMLLAPCVYVARLTLAEPETSPRPERPLWANTLLLTVGRWPTPARLPEGPHFADLARGGIEIAGVYAACDQPGPAAVSLLTGRFGLNHGVDGPQRALPPGAWTLASAALQSGARTAAFLQADFVSRHGIAGFETVREDSATDLSALASQAGDWLAEHPGERRFLWLHAERPGAQGAELEAALGTLWTRLAERKEQFQTLTVFTALAGPERPEPDLGLRVPLRLQLPNGVNARRRAEVLLSQVDLAGTLRELLRLPGPSWARGQAPLQSRSRSGYQALEGAEVQEPLWIDGSFGSLARWPDLRAVARPTSPGAAPALEFLSLPRWNAGPENGAPLPDGQRTSAEDRFWRLRGSLLEGATSAVPSGD
jgi:hypothetical protein